VKFPGENLGNHKYSVVLLSVLPLQRLRRAIRGRLVRRAPGSRALSDLIESARIPKSARF
jgi:hypothetical protein